MEMVLQPRGGAAAAGASSTTMKREQQEADEEEAGELRRGPWTVDEDLTLINYIAEHGDGRWNALARAAGLKRTGKSCRLRWLNYLRPDVKRGDFTADEQLLILDLHSRWGNRWSKIAAQLPGRTDNEIKNYWRTRVQKYARQLNCDVNSRRFKDAMIYLWMPRQAQQQLAVASASGNNDAATSSCLQLDDHLISAQITTTPAATCYGSPGNRVVPSSSSSDSSSLTSTSTDSTAAAHQQLHLQSTNSGGEYCCWEATMQQEADHDVEFWSVINGDGGHHHQFQDDLTGWVQGFCDGIASDDQQSLWSLDDIWKMQ